MIKNGFDYEIGCNFDNNILRQLRVKKGIKQEELSRRTQLAIDTISNLERGRDKDPHLSTLIRLANYFDVSIDLFCNRDKYYYADNIAKKILEFYHRNLFRKDILLQVFDIYEKQDDELSQKRIALVRKIHTADKSFVNILYQLIFE